MTPLSLHCPLGFLSAAEEQEYTPHRNGGKNGICGRSHDPFYYNSNPQRILSSDKLEKIPLLKKKIKRFESSNLKTSTRWMSDKKNHSRNCKSYYGPDGAAGGLSRSTPRRADDTTTRPSGAGPTRQSDDRDSEPDYLLCPTMHGPGTIYNSGKGSFYLTINGEPFRIGGIRFT